MVDDEKRPPEAPPETEGAAPASANAIGTAAIQNTVSASDDTTDSRQNWREVRLVSNVVGEGTEDPRSCRDGFVDQLMDGMAVHVASEGEGGEHDCVIMPAPDVAWPRIVSALMDFCVHGQAYPADRREFRNLFDLVANRKSYARGVRRIDRNGEPHPTSVVVSEGYVPRYNREHAEKGVGLNRAPADAEAYAMAVYDAARYEAAGLRQVVVKGSDDIAEYQPDCNETDAAPYRVLTNRQLERQFRRHGRHLGKRQFERYLGHYRNLLPEVDFTEALSPMECPIANGMLRRDFSGGEVALHVRPYTPEDYRLGKYSGIRFRVGADGVVVPPDEPRIARSGRPDWTPGEWFRDAMPDGTGRRALLAVLILLMFPAVNIEKAIVFYGLGRNGKGTFLAMMRAMVGAREFQQRYLASVGIEKLANEYYLARLVGKLANLVDETDAAYLKHMASAKAAIGGDVVTGRDPYGKAKEFVAKMLFVYCLNTELTTAEQTEAIFNRFAFITFPSSFFDRPGGIDRRIKEDFMQRPEVCSWFAYLALTQVPYFETSAIIDDNAYVVASNAENLAEANPTIRAWRLLREEVETSGEDGPAKWAGVCAMPVCVAHALMSAAKERYEGDAGKLPRQNGRTFRGNLERAAKADGFRIVRNDDGTAKQLPMREWWDEGAMAPLVDALGDEALKRWLKDHADARPRAWLVRDYAGADSSPAARAADEAEADGANFALEFTDYSFSDRALATGNERHDANLRREYGELVGETVAASLAPGGYEVWAAPWRAQPHRLRPASASGFRSPEIVRFSGLAVHDDRGVTPPRDWLRGSPWRVPVVERRVAEGATPLEATRVLLDAVDIMCNHAARVCVSVPHGVVALPGFGAFRALVKAMKACDAGQNADIDTWMVRPVTRRALPPVGGTS